MPFIKMAYDGIKSEWVGGEMEKPWKQKGRHLAGETLPDVFMVSFYFWKGDCFERTMAGMFTEQPAHCRNKKPKASGNVS